MEQFFMVWNPERNAPTFRHPTRWSAVNEAERLARENQGQSFYVLAATDLRCVDNMQRVDLTTPDLPF